MADDKPKVKLTGEKHGSFEVHTVEIDEERIAEHLKMFSQVLRAGQAAIHPSKVRSCMVEQIVALLVIGPDALRRLDPPDHVRHQIELIAERLKRRIAGGGEGNNGGGGGPVIIPPAPRRRAGHHPAGADGGTGLMRLAFWLFAVDIVLAWQRSRFCALLPERLFAHVMGRAGELTYGADDYAAGGRREFHDETTPIEVVDRYEGPW